ncbi:MAG: hypothetical protein F7B17_07300 [Desulfurococcales archaeon]|nr:hypothetical protein [Desulfurococcales archaeon]
MRTLLLALSLAAVIGLIGVAALAASRYNDVSSLAGLEAATRVTVSGEIVNLGSGDMIMYYDGEVFEVDARGYYAIARNPESGRSYVVFLLRGNDGFTIAALYPAEAFIARYGSNPIFEQTVVVDGIFKPSVKIVLGEPGSGGFEKLYEVPVLEVNAILKGCHASYSQVQATA